MTVSYTADVVNASSFGCFMKLLFRWRGSVYKLIWKELIIFIGIFYILHCSYRFLLDAEQQKLFEQVVAYCKHNNSIIPVCFVLGFYVSMVMMRWFRQLRARPFTVPIAIFVNTHLHGDDERSRLMRRTIMRYICVSLTIVLSMIAPRVKKRFPTLQHLVTAGLLQQQEQRVLTEVMRIFPKYSIHWLPIMWAVNIVLGARREGRINDDYTVQNFIYSFNRFRQQLVMLLNFDAISLPLVYTQVVTITIYIYFGCQLLALQWTYQSPSTISWLHFPLFGTLEYVFFIGWLKVAETLLNPFGDDDDDFEVNYEVDQSLRSSYLIVDKIFMAHPKLMRDALWTDILPKQMPYRHGSRRDSVPEHSTAKLKPDNKRQNFFLRCCAKK